MDFKLVVKIMSGAFVTPVVELCNVLFYIHWKFSILVSESDQIYVHFVGCIHLL